MAQARRKTAAQTREGGELITLDGSAVEIPHPRLTPDPVEHVTDPGELPDETPDDEALDKVLGELGDATEGASVKVYRVRDGRKESFVFECRPHEFSLSELQESHGGGEYSVRVYGTRGGVFGLIARKRISVEDPKHLRREAASVPAAGLSPELRLLIEGQQKILETLSKPVTPQPATDIIGLIGALDKLDQMRGGRGPNLDPLQMFDRMAGALGKITAAASGQPTGSNLLDVAREFIPLFRDAMQPRPDAPALPAPGAIPQTVAIDQPQGEPEEIMLLRVYLRRVVENAKRNAGVAEVAEDILALAPPEQLDAMLSRPDWFSVLCGLNPECASYPQWFDQLRNEIMKQIAEDRAEDEAQANAPPKVTP